MTVAGVPGDAVFGHEAIDRAIAGDEIIGARGRVLENLNQPINVVRPIRVGDNIGAEMEHDVVHDIRGRAG